MKFAAGCKPNKLCLKVASLTGRWGISFFFFFRLGNWSDSGCVTYRLNRHSLAFDNFLIGAEKGGCALNKF